MPSEEERSVTGFRVSRTELVWPGKYRDDGSLRETPRVQLPFQVIERINESRATREARKRPKQTTLFDAYDPSEGDTFDAGWRNKLIWGDNLLVATSLLSRFAGKVMVICIDPPFATGSDFSFVAEIGDGSRTVEKEQSAIEEKAYRDTWGRGLDSYLDMMWDRLRVFRDLLADEGTIYVHCDWHVNSYLRSILDDVFGRDGFQSEIIWKRKDANKAGTTLAVVTDTVLQYSKGERPKWNPIYLPHSEERLQSAYRYEDPVGRRYALADLMAPGDRAGTKADYAWKGVRPRKGNTKGVPKLKMYLDESKGTLAANLWTDISMIKGGTEALRYATQKPEALLERILRASSDEGDLVADFFCGSGTTLAAAEKLNRRWIGADISRWAVHVSRKRLLEIQNCRHFEILNLGKYERQYWQTSTFATNAGAEQLLFDYLAFILRLYSAQPIAGFSHIHGKKGPAMVHVGAVDAPVTIDDISTAVDETAKLNRSELHVLGWEWEMGLYDLMTREADKRGVKLMLLQIPREVMERQAVEQGDVRFFELAYLDVAIAKPKRLTVVPTLKDFVIPNTELIPEQIRSKVKKWSDYIDYWAVDWDFQNDTFVQGFVAYRTREDRSLALATEPHTYPKPGKYRIVVKVVDIFGNDTSQAYDVEVK